ncbi:MAG: chain-length determining protein, partial [Nitrospirae bacterium]
LFVITAMIITSVVVLFSYLKPKVYEAKSTILVERNVINDLIKGIAVTPSLAERIRVMSYAMKNRGLLTKVIKKVDFNVDTNDRLQMEKLIEHLQEKTTIRARKEDMFEISYRNKDPKLAMDYVNTLVSTYIEENLSAKRDEAYGANRFLKEQIKFFKEKIDLAERKIIEFRKNKGIIISMDEKGVVAEIKNLTDKVEQLKIKKQELIAKKQMIEKQLKEEKPYTVAILGNTSTTNPVQSRLMALQQRLNELLLKYTENYPEVIRVKAEIETLKAQLRNTPEGEDKNDEEPSTQSTTQMSTLNPIYQQLREELSKTQYEIASIDTQLRHFNKKIEEKKHYLRNIPVERKKLADLERERDTYKEIYQKLVFRLGQSEVSKQMEVQDKAETFRIIDPAILPVKPVSPNRKLMILFGIFAGLGGAFGLLLLIDYFDTSVRTLDALKAFGLPVLAVIPTIENPIETMKKRRKDILLFSAYGLFLALVLAVFTIELLELNYIDKFIASLHIPEHLMSLKEKLSFLVKS